MTRESVLIVGPSWVGDMVMAQSLFRLLKQTRPDVTIDVIAPAWSEPLIDRMPELRRALSLPIGHGELKLGLRRRLGKELSQEAYDQAIVLPNSLKSALLPWFADIPIRTGWRGEMRYGLLNDLRVLDKNQYPLMIERFAALGLEAEADLPRVLPHPKLEVDAAMVAQLCRQHELSENGFLALAPGAEFGPAKRWPERHYAKVAEHWLCNGGQVAIFGSDKDRSVAENVRQQLPPTIAGRCVNLCGKTSLAQAIDLMSAATAVVANDSGLMHIAAALQKPLVVIYGSTSPGFTPPLAERVSVQQIEVDCGPCFQRECPQKHLKCLVELAPERVIAGLEEVMTPTLGAELQAINVSGTSE